MRRALIIAASLAALLPSCGSKSDESRARQAMRFKSPSPIDRPFALKEQKPLDVDAVVKLLPEARRPTYDKVEFDGRRGATIVSKVLFPDPDGEGPRRPMAIERLELYGVDRDAMGRVSAGERDNAAPFETVFVKVRAFGVTPERADDEAASIGAMEWSQLKIRRGAFSPLGDASPTAAHFLNNFELGGLYLKDWSVGGEREKLDRLAFDINDLRIVDLAGGKLRGVVLKDGAYQFSLSPAARYAVGGGFGPVIGALLNGPFGPFLFPAEQRVTVGRAEWRGVDFAGWMRKEIAGEPVGMNDVGLMSLGTIKARKIETRVGDRLASSIEEQTIAMEGFVGAVPTTFMTAARGVVLDLTAYADAEDEAAANLLKARNLDHVNASNRVEWRWDAGKGAASLHAEMDVERLAKYAFTLDLSGVEAAAMENARRSGARADFGSFGALKGLSLRIEEQSLFETLAALTASRTGETPEEVRKQLTDSMGVLAASADRLDPRYKQLLDAMAGFAKEGGAIEIAATPQAPVAFADLGGDPGALARNINLTARHEPPKSKRN
jgi:hypothetical protein